MKLQSIKNPGFVVFALIAVFSVGAVLFWGWNSEEEQAVVETIEKAPQTSGAAKVNSSGSLEATTDAPAKPVSKSPESIAKNQFSGPAILTAIERLESTRDAKCHSSACRFENFMSGTPLTDEGRSERIQRQGQFVRWVWVAASQKARSASQSVVTRADVDSIVETIVRSDEDEEGNLQIVFGNQVPLALSKVRFRQYASIAYSLRAILSVQQESLIFTDQSLERLDDSGVDAIRQALDLTTVSVLMKADQEARGRNLSEINQPIMSAAWEALVPRLTEKLAADSEDSTKKTMQDTKAMQKQTFRVLTEIIAKKVAAYQSYNKISLHDANSLFNNNLVRFYARYPMAEEGPDAGAWARPFRIEMVDFVSKLLMASQRGATQSGHVLIRANDVQQAVQQLTPHEIDEFEDVHFFTRLPQEERITLESYDCDSFRDFGLHWKILHAGVAETPDLTIAPDPFAAEIIAEAISQYGVLLCRAAGQLAERRQVGHLLGVDIRESAELLRQKASDHHAAPEVSVVATAIASARTDRSQESSSNAFFTDVTSESHAIFLHRSSEWLSKFRRDIPASPPTFSGGGVAAEDINNDGYIDLLFVGGNGNALLLNDGAGGLRDITASAGIQCQRPDGTFGEARQPLIVDFDNDGWRDILVTYANDAHRLYRNIDGKSFEEVTAESGLGGEGLIGGPATVFDFDGDGLLDVYICNFGDYLKGAIPKSDRNNTNALPNRLFRNLGDMKFQEVTEGSGVADTGWTQAVSHTDFDRDGRQDIIVANDFGRNSFLRNLGDGRFENVAPSLGVNKAFHSMNVGVCDLNRDDFPDVYISNIATLVKDNKYVIPDADTPLNFDREHMATMLVKEYDVLYLSIVENNQLASYVPATNFQRGPTSTGWAWDAEFFDLDNDGDDDLYVVNGVNDYKFFATVYKQQDDSGSVKAFRESHAQESNVVFINEEGKFKNRSLQSGADFVGNSRSTAYLDIDQDGDLDVAINNFHAPATLLRNNAELRQNHWAKVLLVGNPEKKTNRDAVGARMVAVTAEGMATTREIQCGSGYLSMNPKQQHFGLGESSTFDLQIFWPNGDRQNLEGLKANRIHVIHQGSDEVESTE